MQELEDEIRGQKVKTSCHVLWTDGSLRGAQMKRGDFSFSVSHCVTRSVSPCGFNQADSWSDPIRGEIYHQRALICVTGAY